MDFKKINEAAKVNKTFAESDNSSHKTYIPALHSQCKDEVSFQGAKKTETTKKKLSFTDRIKSAFKKKEEQPVNTHILEEARKKEHIETVPEKEPETEPCRKYSYEEKEEILKTLTGYTKNAHASYHAHLRNISYASDENFEIAVGLLSKGASVHLADFVISSHPEKANVAEMFIEDNVSENFIRTAIESFDEQSTIQAKKLTQFFNNKFKETKDNYFNLKTNDYLLHSIENVAKLKQENFDRAISLTKREKFNYNYLFKFSVTDEATFNKAVKLLDKQKTEEQALNIAHLNDENFATAEKMEEEGYDIEDISKIAGCGNKKFERAVNRKYFDIYPCKIIINLVDIEDKVWDPLSQDGFIDEYIKEKDYASYNGTYDYGNQIQAAGLKGFELKQYSERENLSQLNTDEKHHLMSLLISLDSDFCEEKSISRKCAGDGLLVPKDPKEYYNMVSKLTKIVGVKTKQPSKEAEQNFNIGINSFDDINSPLRDVNFDNPAFKVFLEYSKEDFCNDVLSELSEMNEQEQNNICNLFGFNIQKRENEVQMTGYPVNIENDTEINSIKDPVMLEKIEKVRVLAKHFSEENKIKMTLYPELAEDLNKLTGVLPEILTKIDKKTTNAAGDTSDINTLKILKNIIRDKNYLNLNDNDKKLVKLAVLLQGINPKDDTDDNHRNKNSAFDAYYILSKTDLNEKEKKIVYDLIKNMNWFNEYSDKEKQKKDCIHTMKTASDTAFDIRRSNESEMMKIISAAKLKAENKVDNNELKTMFDEGIKEIEKKHKEIKKTAIYLPQTKIPSASEIKCDGNTVQKVKTKLSTGKEIENTVINFKQGLDLSQYGFEEGLSSDDFCTFLHGLDDEHQLIIAGTGELPDSEMVLSTSYIRYGENEYHVFRPQGLILDSNCDDIQVAYYEDYGSGYKKDYDTIKYDYLTPDNRYREHISKEIKSKLNISDEDYIKLYNEISGTSLTELEKIKPEIVPAIREILKETSGEVRSYGREFNEALISNPEIKGVFCYGENGFSGLPEFLKEFAADNNLPVIYFGK